LLNFYQNYGQVKHCKVSGCRRGATSYERCTFAVQNHSPIVQ